MVVRAHGVASKGECGNENPGMLEADTCVKDEKSHCLQSDLLRPPVQCKQNKGKTDKRKRSKTEKLEAGFDCDLPPLLRSNLCEPQVEKRKEILWALCNKKVFGAARATTQSWVCTESHKTHHVLRKQAHPEYVQPAQGCKREK